MERNPRLVPYRKTRADGKQIVFIDSTTERKYCELLCQEQMFVGVSKRYRDARLVRERHSARRRMRSHWSCMINHFDSCLSMKRTSDH